MTLAEELKQLAQERFENIAFPDHAQIRAFAEEVCRKSLEAAAAKDCPRCKAGVPVENNEFHRYPGGLTERCHAKHILSLLPQPPEQEESRG